MEQDDCHESESRNKLEDVVIGVWGNNGVVFLGMALLDGTRTLIGIRVGDSDSYSHSH